MVINVKIINGTTSEIYKQVNLAYNNLYVKADEYDITCKWFVFTCDNEIMIAGRICNSYNGPIFKQSKGAKSYKYSNDTVDLQRFFIVERYRGIEGLYELFVFLCLEYLIKNEYQFCQSSLIPGRKLQSRLVEMGFEIDSTEIPMRMPSGKDLEFLPITVNLGISKIDILHKLEYWTNTFSKEYTINKNY
jgi:hypothetical protein